MLKLITNIQIARRLLFAFLLAALVPGIIITILGFAFINAQYERSQAALTNIQAFKIASSHGAAITNLHQSLIILSQTHLVPGTKSPEQLTPASWRELQAQLEKGIKDYQRDYQISTARQMQNTYTVLIHDEPDTTLIGQQSKQLEHILQHDWPAYRDATEQVLQAIESKQADKTIEKHLQESQTAYTTLKGSWQGTTDLTEQITNEISRVDTSQTGPMALATVVAFLSTIIIVTAIGYIVYLTITRPLHNLALLTRRIARGDTQARAAIAGHDEISLVATSMNTMLDNIVSLIQEAERQRDALQSQVEKLVSEVSGVGEGDLRVRAEISTNALGMLADSFNYMIEELGSLIIRIKTMSHEVERTTGSIQQHMTQLVNTGQGQLREMSQAAREVEVMTTSNHEVADRSQELYNVARVARQDAQAGREAVRQTIEGIKRIQDNVQMTASKVQILGDRSRQINEIVEAISGIAHQTNRLALDAAIQAAMAGEHGKGFGAVAADIRRLAERSKVQANMISQIVRNVREEIVSVGQSMQDTEHETSHGSRLTREASVALESIFGAVEHQAREIEHIYQMATRQLQSSNAIAQIVQHVSETTRQGSANTQEASQFIENLALLVEQLRGSVEAFKLRESLQAQIPSTTPIDDDIDNPLTVSGVFRSVKIPSQPLRSPAPLLKGDDVLDTRTPLPQSTGQLLSVPFPNENIAQPSPWNADSPPTHHSVLKPYPVRLQEEQVQEDAK